MPPIGGRFLCWTMFLLAGASAAVPAAAREDASPAACIDSVSLGQLTREPTRLRHLERGNAARLDEYLEFHARALEDALLSPLMALPSCLASQSCSRATSRR
jgi:hypothetical protein